jgi:CHRD domain
MRGLRILTVFAIVSLVAAAGFGQTLGAVLTGSQEVPSNSGAGFGNATVTFDAARQNVTVTITAANLGAAINNFHIHEAAAGANGPVRVDLIGLGGTFNNGTMTGTFPIAADVASRMLQNPSNFYVNVHTTQFPGGAVRGQLAYVSGGTTTYAADLRPGNEVPPAATSTAFGSALVTFDFTNRTIAWDAASKNIASPTVSHIHRAPAGTNGPVIINFATAPAQLAGGRTSGNATIAAQQSAQLVDSDITALATTSGANGYYVNVHSQAFGGGEIRGQLVPAHEFAIPIAGRVTNGLGQTFVTDVRVFNPSYTNSTTALLEYFPSSTTANATASASLAVLVPPRGTAVLDDVAGAANLNVSGTTGAIRVSSANDIAVTSRIYADLRGAGRGTQGQFVLAQAREDALRRGVLPQLSHSLDLTRGFRTNIGIFNPTMGTVTVRLELRDTAGNLVEQTTLSIPALSQQQRSLAVYLHETEHLANADNLTLSFDASAPVFVYAAVNDNVSADSILVPAQPDSGTAAN